MEEEQVLAGEPKPEEIIDIAGPEGETLFWQLKAWLIKGHEDQLQRRLDEMWAHYKEISDDRLLALVAALCIEDSVNALLKAIAPNLSRCLGNPDFTFSLRINIARSLRLVPNRILTSCDLIRQMRNEFAHHLEKKVFGELGGKYLQKLQPYVTEFNHAPREPNDHRKLFVDLVGFTLIALQAYTQQAILLRTYIETRDFREGFKSWAEKSR